MARKIHDYSEATALDIVVGVVATEAKAHDWPLDATTISHRLIENYRAKPKTLGGAVLAWITDEDAWSDYAEGNRRDRALKRAIKTVRAKGC